MEELARQRSWEIEERDWQETPEAIKRLVVRSWKELEELRQRIEQLEAENQSLQEKVNNSSRNSHKPPSSDQAKPPKTPEKRKKRKNRGGQPGHQGHNRPLYPVEACSSVEDYYPQICGCCGEQLTGVDSNPYRHQVVEIPPIKLHIEEHRLHQLSCPHCVGKNPSGPP